MIFNGIDIQKWPASVSAHQHLCQLIRIALAGKVYAHRTICKGVTVVTLMPRKGEPLNGAHRFELSVKGGKIGRSASARSIDSLANIVQAYMHRSTLKRILRTQVADVVKANG